jgi:cephalosporin hydroxylase
MTFTPDDLKKAAAEEKAEIESRVRGRQGGVATYFDVLLFKILGRLEASESLHGWNTETAEIESRVKGGQGGSANYFDVPFKILDRLKFPKSLHSAAPPRELSRTDDAKLIAELRWLATYLENRKQGRFVTYEARRRGDEAGRQSDIRSPERAMSQGTAACLSWRGSPLFKSVFDFAILPMLIWELRPGTVFEIGSGTGASARWIADVIESFGLTSQVYSADIKPVTEPYAGVHFLAGDSRSPMTLFGADLLRSAPRPFLVIEDAHANVQNVLLYIDDFLMSGDYLFIEDSLLKGEDLNAFLSEWPQRYLVDTHYTDFFGRNATSAINSIFVKV